MNFDEELYLRSDQSHQPIHAKPRLNTTLSRSKSIKVKAKIRKAPIVTNQLEPDGNIFARMEASPIKIQPTAISSTLRKIPPANKEVVLVVIASRKPGVPAAKIIAPGG
jgi:hypothetical protein